MDALGRVHISMILLVGSWVVLRGGISRVTIVVSHIRGLKTPFFLP